MKYSRVKILKKKDLDLYSLYKKWKQEIADWDDNMFLKVSIKRHYPERTPPQNRYLHMIIGIFADELGWHHTHAYQYFIDKFAPIEFVVNKITGEEIPVKITSSKMNTEQITIFIDSIRLFSMEECKIHLPLPNEQRTLDIE